MGMRKYQRTESAQVVSPQAHQAIGDELRRQGKTSMRDLSEEEKQAVQARLLDADKRS